MGKKGDLSDFECGMVVGARRAGLSISKTADILGFSRTTISRVYWEWSEKEKISSERQLCGRKYLVDVRGQRRIGSSGFFVYCKPGHIAAFRHCSIFCYKSEMTRRQLPAIQSQWRAFDCFPPQWVGFSDYDACLSGFVQIPTLAVFALDYLNYVFPVFGPTVQVRMKTSVCRTFHYLMGHTYSVVKMRLYKVFRQLYLHFKYFAF